MSRSAGPGSPVFFRCSRCRDSRRFSSKTGWDVELTGRTRPNGAKKGHALGVRSTLISREYRCRDCGHVGWSSHVDLQRREEEDWIDDHIR